MRLRIVVQSLLLQLETMTDLLHFLPTLILLRLLLLFYLNLHLSVTQTPSFPLHLMIRRILLLQLHLLPPLPLLFLLVLILLFESLLRLLPIISILIFLIRLVLLLLFSVLRLQLVKWISFPLL